MVSIELARRAFVEQLPESLALAKRSTTAIDSQRVAVELPTSTQGGPSTTCYCKADVGKPLRQIRAEHTSVLDVGMQARVQTPSATGAADGE